MILAVALLLVAVPTGRAVISAPPLVPAAVSDTITVDELRMLVRDLVVVRVVRTPDGRSFPAPAVQRELPASHPLATLPLEHGDMLSYLVSNGFAAGRELLPQGMDSAAASHRVAAALAADERLLDALTRIAERHVTRRGGLVRGVPTAQPDIPLAVAQRVAARFFWADPLPGNPNGIQPRVCAVFNGLTELELRDLALEAFLFEALCTEVQKPRYGMNEEFATALRAAAQEQQWSTTTERDFPGLRASAWSALERSAALRQLLEDAYVERPAAVPFRLVPDGG